MEKPPPPTPSRQGRGSFYGSLSRALNKVPFFSRAQLGVALLLGAALLFLWAWRANFWLPPSPPPATSINLVFVEVAGAAAHPGVYSFDHAPTLAEVWRQAGAAPPPPPGDTKLPSGSRVEIAAKGDYRLGRMRGEVLMTLGLALDLNTATMEDLDALPGIGPALAQRIVEYREKYGPFKKVEDLLKVSGIGSQNLEKLKPYLVLGDQEAAITSGPKGIAPEKRAPVAGEETKAGPGPARPDSKLVAKKPPARPINPNLASLEELQTLPGIGPVLAKRIAEYRDKHSPFKKIDDLMKVSGIGPKKLAKIKPYVIIAGQEPADPDQ